MANIVICADGTWNRPEEDLDTDQASNVLKLARAIAPHSRGVNQHVFYDWGLGSYHSAIGAGVTGQGIHKNILDGYRYIVQNYAPGDSIYLFGFSRGAYTVRALSGLINNCGIVKRPDAKLIQKAWCIYKSASAKNHPDGKDAREFRTNHSHASRKIALVGVWDTVGALGIPFSLLGLLDQKDEFYNTKMGPNVEVARHALAIDERREDFAPTLWTPRKETDLKQVWFSGVHGDVGGSYGADKQSGTLVSDIALKWMLNEARLAGLKLEAHIHAALTDGATAAINRSRRHIYRFSRPLIRPLTVKDRPTKIHSSVKARYLGDSQYRPPNLMA
ncbi:MAG: DUF2235 domain-containing protein, partial [Congregibacter sp.]|nr:DUF2235 domain-containing protein [Congregibacter sp.]